MSDGDVNAIVLVVGGLIALFVLGFVWAILKFFGAAIWSVFARTFIHPLEARLLRRLQDRATARAFGTTVEVVRIRRKADTGG
jgi:hypothetical protein